MTTPDISERIRTRIAVAAGTALDELDLAIGYLDQAGEVEPADALRVAVRAVVDARALHPVLVVQVDVPEAAEPLVVPLED